MSFSSTDTSTTTTTTTTKKNLSLYMWGTNTNGCIPYVDPKAVLDVPTKINLDLEDGRLSSSTSTPASLQKVVCGPSSTAILTTEGHCYTCGTNDVGQLGQGSTNPILVPTLLCHPNNKDDNDDDNADNATTNIPFQVDSIDLGSKFSALIDADGELYTFGSDGSMGTGMGFLGHGNGLSTTVPTLVQSLGEDGIYASQVVVGDSHMTVLTTTAADDETPHLEEVLTTGAGSYGRLGNMETSLDSLYLEPVELLGTGEIAHVAGGHSFTFALTHNGQLYAWGRNDKGQLGTGLGLAVDMYAMEAMPVPLEADELVGRKVMDVAAGHSHAACVTEGGELFFWGSGIYLEPYRVTTLLHTPIVKVSCGQDYTIALDEEGKLYTMGKGKTGVLGQASVKQLNQPALVEALADKKVVSVHAGQSHVACLVEEEEDS
eukprot:CAMPEP_0195299716 /NCGR_PEP_ID=MMETSP0707-20130614/26065_1 /TAXON_ID=33640 /ORGANISM="Asterionellopsis glacialis, Strain CCMP134" /LENGTH=431 /DNA_ID=CAMNT_0040362193 /DNA_START=72 /DNA_END=1367 /DNA_ORIENTATION=-